jgi:hypothetical protein
VDWTESKAEVKYHGLGDDPAAYRISHDRAQLQIEDDRWPAGK